MRKEERATCEDDPRSLSVLMVTVQEEAIPDGLAGNDIVAQAKSGMGKTAVFVVVTLERINADDGLQCVCVVHTRELAYQVAKEFERFKTYIEPKITVHAIYGGIPLPQQEKDLKDDPPHVIVACPGRLKVLIQRKSVDTSNLKVFVIDEVDKVLEKADMRQDVQEIFYKTPKNKQTMCFSATMPAEIKGTVMKFVRNVSSTPQTRPSRPQLSALRRFCSSELGRCASVEGETFGWLCQHQKPLALLAQST